MILDLIYPPVCGVCGKINKKNLCKQCELKIKKYEMSRIEDYREDKQKYFDYQIKTFRYEGILRNKIIDYKFNEKSYIYLTFEKMITNNKKIYSFLEKYDIILYVPMTKKNKFKRGYNQAELIARKLGKSLNIKVERNNLIKIRYTKKQSTLTKTQRKLNVKHAFKIKKPEDIKGKSIILFDDIYTTGNTVNECSRALKKAGASNIAVLTIAVD